MDQVYLARGLIPRLAQFVRADDDLRRDALWAFKNLLTKTPVEEKREIMGAMGWEKLLLPPDIRGVPYFNAIQVTRSYGPTNPRASTQHYQKLIRERRRHRPRIFRDRDRQPPRPAMGGSGIQRRRRDPPSHPSISQPREQQRAKLHHPHQQLSTYAPHPTLLPVRSKDGHTEARIFHRLRAGPNGRVRSPESLARGRVWRHAEMDR
jgi:hypothetical protein